MGMSKYDRLLHILNLLRCRRNLNAGRLASECGVTERSIYRDIVALSEANIPIYYDNGYKLASDSFLPPLNFDLDEFLCLRLALDSSPLNQTGVHAQTIKKIKAKLEACLPESIRKQSRFQRSATRVQIPVTSEPDAIAAVYGDLENAVRKETCIRLRYESIPSGVTERVVEPYFIVFRGRSFYLVAFCRLRNEFRTFRLDRIRELEILKEGFTKRDDIDAESYFNHSWEVFGGDPVEVVVRLKGKAAQVVRLETHHENETIMELVGGEVEYRVITGGTEEIERWILGLGDEAVVLAPPQLRNRIRDIAKRLTSAYRRSD